MIFLHVNASAQDSFFSESRKSLFAAIAAVGVRSPTRHSPCTSMLTCDRRWIGPTIEGIGVIGNDLGSHAAIVAANVKRPAPFCGQSKFALAINHARADAQRVARLCAAGASSLTGLQKSVACTGQPIATCSACRQCGS
jgi:hypothetical protein